MNTEMGEYVVGAYLKEALGCDFVDYNIRPPGGGLEGLGEMDVVGLRFKDQTAFMCEVTTHLDGLHYRKYTETSPRIKDKFSRQQTYAHKHLAHFKNIKYIFWSPVVLVGVLTKALAEIDGLELIINREYTRKVEDLERLAENTTRDTGNPFFRALQLLKHLRKIGDATVTGSSASRPDGRRLADAA